MYVQYSIVYRPIVHYNIVQYIQYVQYSIVYRPIVHYNIVQYIQYVQYSIVYRNIVHYNIHAGLRNETEAANNTALNFL